MQTQSLSRALMLKILTQEQSCHSFTPTSVPAQLLDKYLTFYKKKKYITLRRITSMCNTEIAANAHYMHAEN